MSPPSQPERTSTAGWYQPLVLVLAALATGMVVDRNLPLGPYLWFGASAVLLFLWMVSWRLRHEQLGSLFLLAGIAGAGSAWHHDRWNLYRDDEVGFFVREEIRPLVLEGVAVTSPRWVPAPPLTAMRTIPKGDETELFLRVTSIRNGQIWQPASGNATVDIDGHLLGVRAGDKLRLFVLASRPRGTMNPGEFDFAKYERSRRIFCKLRGIFPESIQPLSRGSGVSPRLWLSEVRERGNALLRRNISPRRSSLAAAILIGAREQLDPERNEGFLVTGTIHILSISGLHVGILAFGFWTIFRTGVLPRGASLIAAMVLTILYAFLTDLQPPVVRATILVVAMCAARFMGRTSYDPLDRLIARTRPWHVRLLKSAGGETWRVFLTGAVIWGVSLPIVWKQYGLISPVGLFLNPIVWIPITISLFAGFGVLVFGWIFPPLGQFCGWLCDGSLWFIEASIDRGQHAWGSYFWYPAPPPWWVAVFYIVLGLAAAFPLLRPSQWWTATLLACWTAVALFLSSHSSDSVTRAIAGGDDEPPLRCTFVSVGHGTSCLMELPDGQTLLYDAGKLGSPMGAARSISAVLWSRGITHLDAVMISHADSDHFSALPELLQRFSVGVIYVSPVMFDNVATQPALIELKAAIDKSGVPLKTFSAGDKLRSAPGTRLEALHPPRKGVFGSDNANSIVLLVEYEGRRILLPGDLESPGLEDLMAEEPLDCDVLMAPHHGSRRSDPAGFALWSKPEFVLFSGDRNVEDIPDIEMVKDSYRARGAEVYHTAEDGSVCFELTRSGVKVQSHRPHNRR
ncbi:MAG: ComEC/Rec2 family competence protein [Planctomycetales bacterium]|nr:ComEC/Rec2 family competence protein [Planctomycetales bacterium]